MLCQNCGKREANFHYTQIINGEKTELRLCSSCANEMGMDDLEMPMSLDFSSLLGDFFHEYEDSGLLPDILGRQNLRCNTCQMTYDELLQTGKFGCADCYHTFRDKISPLLKNIHGNNKHVGRIGRVSEDKIQFEAKEEKTSAEDLKIEKLKEDLKNAIKEERYEDAAKLRDKIQELDKKNEKE